MKGKKTGGRVKGTPNRTGFEAKKIIGGLLTKYMEEAQGRKHLTKMEEDLAALSPSERIRAYTQLLAYVAPKQQAISIQEQTQIEEEALTNWLQTAPEEAITAISEKILLLQAANRQTQA